MSIFEPLSGMEFQKKYGTPSLFGLVRTMHYVSGAPIFDELMKKEKEYSVDVTASKNAISIKFSKSIVSSTQIAVPTS